MPTAICLSFSSKSNKDTLCYLYPILCKTKLLLCTSIFKMHYSLVGIVAALLPAVVLAAPQGEPAEAQEKGKGLPPCSMKARPCACPKGSTFGNSTTYVTIGARASDVRSVVDNCECP